MVRNRIGSGLYGPKMDDIVLTSLLLAKYLPDTQTNKKYRQYQYRDKAMLTYLLQPLCDLIIFSSFASKGSEAALGTEMQRKKKKLHHS